MESSGGGDLGSGWDSSSKPLISGAMLVRSSWLARKGTWRGWSPRQRGERWKFLSMARVTEAARTGPTDLRPFLSAVVSAVATP